MNEAQYEEILNLIVMLTPKIKKELIQTSKEYREDLEQELLEFCIKKLLDGSIHQVPGFFEFLENNK